MTRLLCCFCLLGIGSAAAGEPLPPPRVLDTSLLVSYPLPNPLEVWQNYGVDRFGRFRPRVIYVPPADGFYLYNGKPYPWLRTRPEVMMPYIVD
jgi:hypothetical protein